MDETIKPEDIKEEIHDIQRTIKDAQAQGGKDFALISHMEDKLRRLKLRYFAAKHKN